MGNESLPATARLTAAGRAVENRRADRLFEDPLAEALAGEDGFRLMEQWRLPGAPSTIGPRTRFYDDLVIDAVANGLGQVVLVAAGMDTRAFRLALPAGGFDHAVRTVFIVEGLSWYLTEEENARLLDELASLAAPGSRLGIDIISRDHLESPASAPLFKFTAALGILWQFGTNDPAGFLAAHGWQAEVTDLDAFARRVGRWPPPDVADDLATHADASARSYLHQRQTRSASVLLH